MGVVGAGLATAISQLASMIYLLAYYLSGSSYLKLRIKNMRLDLKILKPMFSIGVASFVQVAAGSLSTIFLINLILSYGGDTELSAYGIVQRILMFAGMPGMVIGQALQPVLGYNYGAKRFGLCLRAVNLTVVVGTIIMAVAFIIVYLMPGQLVRIFTSDQALVNLSVHASKIMFLSLPIMGVVNVGQVIFQALGQAMRSFITAIVRPLVFLIPSVYVMSHFWQLDGVFLSFPTADFLTMFLIIGLCLPVILEFRKLSALEKKMKTGNAGQLESLTVAERNRITELNISKD